MIDLRNLIFDCHKIAKDHGFWDQGTRIPEWIALMHSELSEALECYRKGEMTLTFGEDDKPEGFVSELADLLIRLMDFVGGYELTDAFLNNLIKKVDYNKTRSFMHGGKKL